MTSWIHRPGDDKIQEAALIISRIGFSPARVDELLFSDLETLMQGMVILTERHIKQLTMRTIRAFGAFQKEASIEAMLTVLGAMLDEKVVLGQLRIYAGRMGNDN